LRVRNPLKMLREVYACAAPSSPVAWLGSSVVMTALVTTQAAAQFAPPNTQAVPASAPSSTMPTVGSNLTMPQLAAPNAAATTVREHLTKARKAMVDGQNGVALQAYVHAATLGSRIPEMAAELQQVRDQLQQKGISAMQLDTAMKQAAMAAPALLPPAAPANPQLPSLANAIQPQANAGQANAMPANPLRDQAAALAAQAKLALARGDVANARQMIDRANSLRVPESDFATGQLKPWQVQMEVERAERAQGTTLASAPMNPAMSMNQGVVTASVQQASGGMGNPASVQTGVFQPSQDATSVAAASATSSNGGGFQLPVDSNASGDELYRNGVAALTAGKRDEAVQLFQQAWKKQDSLDANTRAQLRDKLMLLQSNPGSGNKAPEAISPLQQANDEASLLRQKLFREVTGEIAESERMVNEAPLQALDRLQLLRQRVSQSQVDGAYRKQMLAMVDRVLNNVQGYVDQNKSQIELNARNAQIEAENAADAANRAKLDSELQRMVDQFNDLMEKGSFEEAEIVAKKVGEMAPETELATLMYQNAKIRRRQEEYLSIQRRKEEGFNKGMLNVDEASVFPDDSRPYVMPDARTWQALSNIRKNLEGDSITLTPAEREIREKLTQPISVSFNQRPLSQAVNTLMDMVGIPILIDQEGLRTEGYTSDLPINLDLRGKEISLKSTLTLMLEPLHLTYVIKNDVLRITSKNTATRARFIKTYPVKDLVIPIPNFVNDYNSGLAGAIRSAYINHGQQLLVQTEAKRGTDLGRAQLASIDPSLNVLGQPNLPGLPGVPGGMPGMPGMMGNPWANNGPPAQGLANPFIGGTPAGGRAGGGVVADFQSLIQLITSTVEANWEVDGGTDTIREFGANLSLIVNAPQETHEAIAELLTALRKLQNLQVTIEVRFITLTDTFFERIGVDFELGFDDNNREIPPEDFGPKVTVGIGSDLQPTADLDVRLTNGTIAGATPQFGTPDADAGGRFGFAILSDIELFFLLEAAQGDSRTNVLQAPKVTMFDGQTATITDQAQRPFVIGLNPVVGDFAVAQQPIIAVLNDGTNLTVQAVVTQDKRFVRLTLVPMFTRIQDADRTFTFTGSRTVRTGSTVLDPDGNPTDGRDDEETIIEGSTVQLPTLGNTSVNTTVTVPDGGTILLGGIKRLREGRTERGIPLLSKVPYISRLFKNVGVGRETSTLMLTVTPRIIIPEEEEEKVLGTSAFTAP